MEWLKSIHRFWAMSFGARPSIQNDEFFSGQSHWYKKEFEPIDDVDYGSSLKYAESEYQSMVDVYRIIDTKAEWLFGIAVTLASGLTAAIETWHLPFLSFWPAYVAILLVLHLSLRCRAPGRRAARMDVRSVIQLSESKGSRDALLAAAYHCAICGLERAVAWKSQQLENASRTMIAVMLLAAVGFAATRPFTFVPSCLEGDRSSRKSHELAAGARQHSSAHRELRPAVSDPSDSLDRP